MALSAVVGRAVSHGQPVIRSVGWRVAAALAVFHPVPGRYGGAGRRGGKVRLLLCAGSMDALGPARLAGHGSGAGTGETRLDQAEAVLQCVVVLRVDSGTVSPFDRRSASCQRCRGRERTWRGAGCSDCLSPPSGNGRRSHFHTPGPGGYDQRSVGDQDLPQRFFACPGGYGEVGQGGV